MLCVSGVMPDWLGSGSESHTPEQSQQQTESLCLMHILLLLPLMAPKLLPGPVANALLSKTPVSALLSNAIEQQPSCPMFPDPVSQAADG